jgi:ABC-2 type transport system ATP-binding protein
MTVPPLCLRDVVKRYGQTPALRGVSLEIGGGESFALVGANGAGKTTLLKCVLDFCAVDGGRIEIFGHPPSRPEARRTLCYLPENFLPPHYLTGREFLRLLVSLRGMPYSEADVAAHCAALEFDPAALGRLARTYSKGMTRKLGLLACLQSRAPLLLLDEPMSGLDPKARVLVKREFARLSAAGHTLFFSSHLLADVEELCSRMAILHEGVLRFVGSPADCRARFSAASLEAAYLAAIA